MDTNKNIQLSPSCAFPADTSKSGRGIVSIIIPSFNSVRTLRYTLPTILGQDRAFIADIIVVDSSDDGLMPELIREFEPRGIRFIISGVRVMPAVQRNIGARESRGALLLFLDSDVLLEKDYIPRIVSFYLQGHLAGFGSVTVPCFQARKTVVIAQYYLQLNEYLPGGEPRIKPFILGCSNFVDRGIFEQVGGYPEIRAAEDVVYGLRLNRFCSIWFFPQVSVAHIFREEWTGYFRNQELLGKYVARYRKEESDSLIFKGFLPVFLFPVFLAVKCCRIIPRILKAGPAHTFKCALVMPFFMLGLFFWCIGFVKEAMNRE